MSGRAGPGVRERARGGLLGLLVGDALGAPVEFHPREELRSEPVEGLRPNGDLPPGTWSDDGSLALATAASLTATGYDPSDIMERFRRWLLDGEYTPHGRAWGVGATTQESILRFDRGLSIDEAGGRGEQDNGNGSLMRILPLSLWVAGEDPDPAIEKAFEVSSLTHAHVRAMLCCAYHARLVRELVGGAGLREAMAAAAIDLDLWVPDEEREVLDPILSGEILERSREEIDSSGYVVHTLGASLWCLARHEEWRGAVLEAVNLGGDADTTGAVTGGLAGVIHGAGAIPQAWIDGLERCDYVLQTAERFADALAR